MKITVSLADVADETSRLIVRAVAASGADPDTLRAVTADTAGITAAAAAARGRLAVMLGRHFGGMGGGSVSWTVTLFDTPWQRSADPALLRDMMQRVMSHTAAGLLLAAGPMASAGERHLALAASEADRLTDLLDSLTAVPPPGRVRRPLW